MNTTRLGIIWLLLSPCCTTPAWSAVTFDWATVGNPGNADDTFWGYGGVGYTYRISKHEVTNAQYTEFLNAVDPNGANSLSLYTSNMSSDAVGGIDFNSGAAIGSKYEIKSGRDNNPVVFVSFFDAMRFVNWLENGQGSGDTESGVYTIGSGTDEVRNLNATYFIPSEDEWYKAAYYDPNASIYYDYPTGHDTQPYSDNPSSLNTPDDTNVANIWYSDEIANGYDDGYAVTGSTSFDNSQNYLTDVGAYSLTVSPYGTFDQGGNVWEWTEAVIEVDDVEHREWRGGNWRDTPGHLPRGVRAPGLPTWEFKGAGFRVAIIPELLMADFDRDGDVDGDDFLAWQASFGVNGDGDADGDGDTDGDDFLIWQSQFGSGSGSVSAAVPEPASIVLILTALVGAALIARRH